MAPLVWLVTGATSGLGRTLVSHIISRGDRVVATGRNAEQRLADLRSENVGVVDLDVSEPKDEVAKQVKKAWEVFGRIDVLINNAGVSQPKALEEGSDEYTQNLFNVNVFGPVRVAQAILPLFRQQGSGFIAFIGAGLSWGGIPFLNFYSAAKAALNAFAEGFRNETRNQPIQCTILEPGGFNSELGKARAGSNEGFGAYQPVIEPYVSLWNEVLGVFVNEITPNVPGEIEKFAKTILELLGDEETRGKLPVRVILGSDAVGVVKQKCEEQLSLLEEYKDVSKRTDKDGAESLDYSGTVNLTSILR